MESSAISSKKILIFDSLENVIDTLRIDENVVKLINESKNQYIKVVVYKEGECGGCSDTKTGVGWMKIIDDEGHPRIYFYTRGC